MASRNLFVVGASHHTAPVEIRERLALDEERLPDVLRAVGTHVQPLSEVVLLSTCNRCEFYGVADDPEQAANAALRWQLERAGLSDENARHFFVLSGDDAVRHAFRVTASLDSLVVGEPQVTAQVKTALALAADAGTQRTLLRRLFDQALAAAKRVRTETDLSSGKLSIGSVAVDLAEKIFGDLHDRRVLLVGAGKMGELSAKRLVEHGARLGVVNRTFSRASHLAQLLGGTAHPFEGLDDELIAADVVITSTAATDHLLSRDQVAMIVKRRRHRPMFIIDIAVPRNVDPTAADVEGVFLYDVDDLQEVAGEAFRKREGQAQQAAIIIDEEVRSFIRWARTLAVAPTIVSLRDHVHSIIEKEVARSLARLNGASNEVQDEVRVLAQRIGDKVLHAPSMALKHEASEHDALELAEAAERLFGLAVDPSKKTKLPSGSAS